MVHHATDKIKIRFNKIWDLFGKKPFDIVDLYVYTYIVLLFSYYFTGSWTGDSLFNYHKCLSLQVTGQEAK